MKFNITRPIHFLLCVVAISITCLLSCQKGNKYIFPDSNDKTKPGTVTNVKVKNFNGGAVLTYSLPNDQNLLYVQANYMINNKTVRQSKSSYFLDTIRVEGFQSSKDYTVTLTAVTRANISSDPVTVTVHPDTPYYELVRKSLKLSPDFGGINIQGLNVSKSAVGLNMVNIDPVTKKFIIADNHYTSSDTIDYSVRGYPTTPATFGVFVTDNFGNVSDTLIVNATPLFEELLDKSKFFTYQTNSDSYIGYGGILPYLWDGFTLEGPGQAPWQTTIGPIPKPIQGTFGVGRTYKLSHFTMWVRSYGYANPEDFTIWGSNVDNPADAVTPGGAAAGTVSGDWTALGSYHFPDPPSGLPQGQTNNADQAFINAGVDFDVPFNSPAVKYIRVEVKDTWFGLDYTYIEEISFYGNPQ